MRLHLSNVDNITAYVVAIIHVGARVIDKMIG